MKRILLAGGGTGGHIFPALALADALKAQYPDADIRFVGAVGGMEMTLVPKAGYPIEGVWISGLYRQKTLRNLARNLLLPLKFVVAHLQSWAILRRFRPDVVIGVGGYASYTTLGVAKRMGNRHLRVIQEQNAFPGLTNRVHARHAHLVLLGNAAAQQHFPAHKCVITGNVVRQQIRSGSAEQLQALHRFPQPEQPHLLVTGGSLGARTLNRAMAAALPRLAEAGIQVLWQCGKLYEAEYAPMAAQYSGVRIVPFISHMGDAYAWADLAVGRAGAGTLAELAAVRLPAILVPSPNVADDHQTHNARSLADVGGARLLPDAQAEAQLGDMLLELLSNPPQLLAMRAALAAQPPNDAAARMVDAITSAWAALKGTPIATAVAQGAQQAAASGTTAGAADTTELTISPGSKLFFSGIGGIGMSALARFLHRRGHTIAGYDRTETPLTCQLAAEGMAITYDLNDTAALAGAQALVYTPAVGADNPALLAARAQGIPTLKRAKLLGELSRHYSTLAVAGTHGKTTTSSLLTYLLEATGQAPTAFVGGIMTNYDTNCLVGSGPHMVAEADEFDRSFLHLHPAHLILTSVDADHLDIYGTPEALHTAYNQLVQQVKPGGVVVLHENCRQFIHIPSHVNAQFYGLNGGDVTAEDVRFEGLNTYFTYRSPAHTIPGLCLRRPGDYNLLNALAAITVALAAGATPAAIAAALPGYKGVKRRFEVHIDTPELVYVDDYAHHPAEIAACLGAIRQAWPGHKLVALFQPHLFSRTRDFAEGFAQSLDAADVAILMHIYPARELSIPHVSSLLIYQQMRRAQGGIINLHDAVDAVLPQVSLPCVVVSLGAGDIDTQVEALRHSLLSKFA
jgi:UDP-N-acetylmuramate--alanine ligase